MVSANHHIMVKRDQQPMSQGIPAKMQHHVSMGVSGNGDSGLQHAVHLLCRWLDTHTRRLVEETLNLTGELTFTVRPQLTAMAAVCPQQRGGGCCCLLLHLAQHVSPVC